MRMMEVITDEIVDMITMWYGLVSASRTVSVTVFVSRALMIGRAPGGIGVRDLNRMLRHPIAFWMMQMPIMQVVDVISVLNRRVATTCAVFMRVVAMLIIRHRECLPYQI